jgi:hypothetical protein
MVSDPVRTRYGVGEVRIDHAAGVPLGLRRSNFAPRSFPVPPTTDWDDEPNVHDGRRLRHDPYDYDDDRVELPMEPRRTALLIAGAIAILFIVVCASIAFSGISATTLIGHNGNQPSAPQAPR